MSMISEFVEKLIERLETQPTEQFVGIYGNHELVSTVIECCVECVNQLAEEYKDVPSTNVGKWIPVSEKLPDDFMSYEYLTIRKGQTLATITYYCVVNHKWYSNRKSTKEIDVVAWQPLPSYKGE